MYLTARDAAQALDLSYYTVVRELRADEDRGEEDKAFPHAYLQGKARSKGWRIPAGDVRQVAQGRGEDVVAKAERIIAAVTERDARRADAERAAILGDTTA